MDSVKAYIFTENDISIVHRARNTEKIPPDGKYGRNGCWFPSDRELAGRTLLPVKYPTERFPFNYRDHCKTRRHIAYLAQYNPIYFSELLAASRRVLGLPTETQRTIVDYE